MSIYCKQREGERERESEREMVRISISGPIPVWAKLLSPRWPLRRQTYSVQGVFEVMIKPWGEGMFLVIFE